MELSNELFKWLQGDAETSVYCAKRAKQASPSLFGGSMRPWFHLLSGNLLPSAAAPAPKEAHPSLHVRRQPSERKDHRLFWHKWRKTVCQETHGDTITNLTVRLHCSHHNLNVSINDGICLRLGLPSTCLLTCNRYVDTLRVISQ